MKLRSLLYAASAVAIGASAATSTALADDDTPPGLQALETFRNGRGRPNPVQNRFFLKQKRFELSPQVGFVPNNPFARRITFGLGLGYHFNEQLSVQGNFSFAPDLGERDIKSLTDVLLVRATDDDFRQPLDKVTLSAAFGVQYAPFYGKINLLGEAVLNFDFYAFLGLGLVVQTEYAALENPNATSTADFIILEKGATEVRPAPVIALGGDFFLTQSVALRLDGRFTLFPDDKPVYDESNPPPGGQRLVTQFRASAGISVFFPRMKPRLYDF